MIVEERARELLAELDPPNCLYPMPLPFDSLERIASAIRAAEDAALERAVGVVFDAICVKCSHELDMERLRERIRSLKSPGVAGTEKP